MITSSEVVLVSSAVNDTTRGLTSRIVRTLKSTVLPGDHFKIKSLQEEFSRMEKDFDRAVSVETLAHLRNIGMVHHGCNLFYFY